MDRINIGCGTTPSAGWLNFDNTPAIKLANSPLKYRIAKLIGMLNKDHIKNIEWNKKNNTFHYIYEAMLLQKNDDHYHLLTRGFQTHLIFEPL